MHPRDYSSRLKPVRVACPEFRMTVRNYWRPAMHCDLYQQVIQPRGAYVLWEHVDTWVADTPLTVVRTLDDVRTLFTEGLIQQRLPGIG